MVVLYKIMYPLAKLKNILLFKFPLFLSSDLDIFLNYEVFM